MNFKRADRIGEVIKKEISFILLSEITDPLIGFVTVTNVKVSDDLRVARVYYSIFGEGTEKSASQEGLERAKGYIRKALGKRLRMRYVPDLKFQFDDSLEYGAHIESLIDELKEKDGR